MTTSRQTLFDNADQSEILSISAKKSLSLAPVFPSQELKHQTDLDERKVGIKDEVFDKTHPEVIKEMQRLIHLCSLSFHDTDLSDTNFQMPVRYYIELSLQHFIRECIEVISWLQKNDESFTYLYSKDLLPKAVEYAVENIKKLDASYYPQRTLYFNPEKQLIAKANKRKSLGKTLETNEANDLVEDKALQLTSKNAKVFLPICYGFGMKHNDISFHKVVDSLKQFLNVSSDNITIYLGPHEEIGPTPEQNTQNEKIYIKNWLDYQERYLEDNNIQIIIHNHDHVELRHQPKSIEWEESAEYKAAEEIFYKMLVHKDHIKLGYKLKDDVIGYVKPKFEKVIAQAKEEKKSTAVLNVETLNRILLPIQFQIAYNTYITNCLMVMLSQRDENRFFTDPITTPILFSENKVEEESVLIPRAYEGYRKEVEEEKTQLVVTTTVVHPNNSDVASIPLRNPNNNDVASIPLRKPVTLKELITQELPSMNTPAEEFKVVKEFYTKCLSAIEHENPISNTNRIKLFEMLIKNILSYISRSEHGSSSQNYFLNKLSEVIIEYSLFQNPLYAPAKIKIDHDILRVKLSLCPLEVEVEKFIKIFDETNSSAGLRFLVREILRSIEKIAADKSLSPSYALYISIYIKVMSSTVLVDKSHVFGLFKSPNKRELINEISSAAMNVTLTTRRKNPSNEVFLQTMAYYYLFSQHRYIPTLFEQDPINTALRNKLKAIFNAILTSFEKGNLKFRYGPELEYTYEDLHQTSPDGVSKYLFRK